MPIWIERTAARPYLCYRFSGMISLEDLDRLDAAEEPHFADLGHVERLGIIMDLSAIDTIPSRLFPQLQQMRLITDERVCALCVVGANPYLRALAISLGLVHNSIDISFRRTIEEAIVILDHRIQAKRASSES